LATSPTRRSSDLAGAGVEALAAGVAHHAEEVRIDEGLALEVEGEGPKVLRQFVDHTFEEAVLQVARGPGKGSQAAGALGAAQVAGGGGLDADADGKPLDARHLRPFRLAEAAPDAVGIARPAQRERTGPQAGIAEFGQHGRKVPVRGPGHSNLYGPRKARGDDLVAAMNHGSTRIITALISVYQFLPFGPTAPTGVAGRPDRPGAPHRNANAPYFPHLARPTRTSPPASMKSVLISLLLLCGLPVLAQHTVTGRVVDAATKEPLAFVPFVVEGTRTGTTSDIDGRFRLTVPQLPVTLRASYVGYVPAQVSIADGEPVTVLLEASNTELSAVEVKYTENPAHRIIRQVHERRKENDGMRQR